MSPPSILRSRRSITAWGWAITAPSPSPWPSSAPASTGTRPLWRSWPAGSAGSTDLWCVLEGEMYKRPKGDPGPLLFPWYNRKNIALTWDRNCEGSLFTPELAGEAEESFRFLKPYYDYFLSLRGDPAPDASR